MHRFRSLAAPAVLVGLLAASSCASGGAVEGTPADDTAEERQAAPEERTDPEEEEETEEPAEESAAEPRPVADGELDVVCVDTEEELLEVPAGAEGTTDWARQEWPPPYAPADFPEPDQAFSDPEELMAEVAEAYITAVAAAPEEYGEAGEHRAAARLLCEHDGDRAQGLMVERDVPEGPAIGNDVRFTLERGEEGWRTGETVELRSHCRDGMSGGVCA